MSKSLNDSAMIPEKLVRLVKKRIICYTVITGNYNKLQEIDKPSKKVNYICFSDRKIPSQTWKVVKACNIFKKPVMNAKIHKILPHLYFDCAYSLWIDGSIRLTGDILTLIDISLSKNCDLAGFKHKSRNSPYKEAEAVIKFGLAKPLKVKKQMETYNKEGFKTESGLTQGNVLLRRHSRKMELFNNAWWAEICRHTSRDQLSLDYAAYRSNIKINHFPLPKLYENNEFFKYYGHKKSLNHMKVLLRTVIRGRDEISRTTIKKKVSDIVRKI